MTAQTLSSRTPVAERRDVIGNIGRFGYANKTSTGAQPGNSQTDIYMFLGSKVKFDEIRKLMSEMPGYIPVASESYPNITGVVGDCAVNIRCDARGNTRLVIANEEQSKRQATLERLEEAFA
jgi:Ca2+-binding EF-hand superfamily protein